MINKYVPDVVLSDRGPIDEDGEAIPRKVLVRLMRASKIHGTYHIGTTVLRVYSAMCMMW